MLEVIGAAPGSHTDVDWHKTWRESPEYKEVHRELDQMKDELPQITQPSATPDDRASFREFAAPFGIQQWEVTKRVFEQYWRTPSYIYSKFSLCVFSVRIYYAIASTSGCTLKYMYRHSSSASRSSRPVPASRSSRTRCSRFSCSLPFSDSLYSRSCRTL